MVNACVLAHAVNRAAVVALSDIPGRSASHLPAHYRTHGLTATIVGARSAVLGQDAAILHGAEDHPDVTVLQVENFRSAQLLVDPKLLVLTRSKYSSCEPPHWQ